MKQRNRLIIVFSTLLCVSVMASIASAEQVEVHIEDASGSYEAVVDVSIVIANADDVGSLDLVFTYNPTILQVQEVTRGDATNGMISSNIDTEGIVAIGIVDQNGIDEDGEIAVISFTVLQETGSSPLRIENLFVYDVNSLEITAAAQDGTFTVTESIIDDTPGFIGVIFVLSFLIVLVVVRGKKR
ncbi:MAG: cohesin domain-containing protein [Candidatus Thermoplasmatota archaeon]|nr:cohesin domain-containing protein [Candidatus Thermoplasmatota archaeon]